MPAPPGAAMRGKAARAARRSASQVALSDVQAELQAWDTARAARDYEKADAIRGALVALGINPRHNGKDRRAAEAAGYYDCDEAWVSQMRALKFISAETCLASTSFCEHSRLPRYRDLPPAEAFETAVDFGRIIFGALAAGPPAVVCVFKPYLDGFVEGFAAAAAAASSTVGCATPFVLLCVNGGDKPLSRAMQGVLNSLPGLRACFATNLLSPADPRCFRPLPIGLAGGSDGHFFEASLAAAAAAGPLWEARDCRLLVPPMKRNGRGKVRDAYIDVLSRPEFAPLVHIVHERLPLRDFLALLARHRCALSPPGRGYDSFRTWQAVALGTVPLVTVDAAFDARLYEDRGPVVVPRPEDLTPDRLREILAAASPPTAAHISALTMEHWAAIWGRCLQDGETKDARANVQ